MFSQTVEYALRTMSYLGSRWPEATTTRQIAKATHVPPAYLSKVIQALVRAGIAISRRGIGGGVNLARAPDSITILDIVNAVDPIHRIERCPLGLAAHGVRLCPMHSRLDDALATIEDTFRNTTLAEVMNEPASRGKRCKFPFQPNP